MTSYFLSTGKTLLDESVMNIPTWANQYILVIESKMITMATFVFNQKLFISRYENKMLQS